MVCAMGIALALAIAAGPADILRKVGTEAEPSVAKVDICIIGA